MIGQVLSVVFGLVGGVVGSNNFVHLTSSFVLGLAVAVLRGPLEETAQILGNLLLIGSVFGLKLVNSISNILNVHFFLVEFLFKFLFISFEVIFDLHVKLLFISNDLCVFLYMPLHVTLTDIMHILQFID